MYIAAQDEDVELMRNQKLQKRPLISRPCSPTVGDKVRELIDGRD